MEKRCGAASKRAGLRLLGRGAKIDVGMGSGKRDVPQVG
jgi:hypothetical protein